MLLIFSYFVTYLTQAGTNGTKHGTSGRADNDDLASNRDRHYSQAHST